MNAYTTNQIKNVALLGNSGAGKTTFAEDALFNGGVIDRKGDVEHKNTVSDYREIEHDNESSVFSTLLYTEINNQKVNIIDNPGLDDFSGGVVSSLQVADMGIMLINAQNGFEVGTEIHTRYINQFNKPIVFVINFLDHDKANWEKSIEALKERYKGHLAQVQFPVGQGNEFRGIVDVIMMKMYQFNLDTGKPEFVDIPEEFMDQAKELQNELIEKAAENDESLMEIFFEKETLTEDEMRSGIKKGLANGELFPVFCASSKKNVGINRCLEFITNVGPSPDEMPTHPTKDGKENPCSKEGEPCIFFFKTSIEPHIGEVNFFKVMSGEVKEGMDLTNSRTKNKERLTQLYVIAGKNRSKVPKLEAGDIGATVKLKNTKVNDTLSLSGSIDYPDIVLPEPKYRAAIRPLAEGDEEKLSDALHKYHEEDPTIRIDHSKELKQIIVSGQGEYHLNILKWHLEHIHKVSAEFFAPKIPYRETITKMAGSGYRHKKQSGGAGQFGEVHMVIEPYEEGMPDPTNYKIDGKDIKISVRNKEEHPLPWGGMLIFYNCIVGGAIDARFLPAVVKGIMEKMEEGPLTGSYARDIRVALYDGKMHPVDSNEISFKLAGRNAFKEAFKNAGPKIMEPIYDLEVLVPSDHMGDVMSDLQGRRAIVQGMSSEAGFEKITAKVPLSEMNKYSTALSSLTSGRAMYTMKFGEYSQVPGDIQEKLLREYEELIEEEH
ncbi:MAG: elongation factor G [Bacteroidetes bacterium]|jgi:elongation factor G|nr:elongation factor G [Bacteroidota bacterium]